MQSTKLVKQLRERASLSLDEVARLLDVSTRTARAYIHDTNTSMEGIAAIRFSRRDAGYRLEIADAEKLDSWMTRMAQLEGVDGVEATRERVSYLLYDLLCRSGWVTIADLASVLFVTPQRISRDLKQVESKLSRFGLAIEKRPRYGIRVTGDEFARRLCLASLSSHEQITRVLGADDEESQHLLEQITHCLEDVVQTEGFPLSGMAFQNLVVHIYVALVRIRENCYVPMDALNVQRIQATPEYAVACKVAAAVEGIAGVELPEEEIVYIAIHLAGKKTLNGLIFGDDADASEDDETASPVISDNVWNVVSEILDKVYERYDSVFGLLKEYAGTHGTLLIIPTKENLDVLASDDGQEKAEDYFQDLTYVYGSPGFLWRKDFDFKNDTFESYCKKKGYLKAVLCGILPFMKHADMEFHKTRALNYTVK